MTLENILRGSPREHLGTVAEALIKRGENVEGVYVAPGKEGAKGRPGQGGGACRQAARYRPDSQKNRRLTTCSTASVSLPIRSNDFSLLVTSFPRLNKDQVWVACRPNAVLIILKLAEHF
jgi:hypothetical protein